jgi:hypothetical protein
MSTILNRLFCQELLSVGGVGGQGGLLTMPARDRAGQGGHAHHSGLLVFQVGGHHSGLHVLTLDSCPL